MPYIAEYEGNPLEIKDQDNTILRVCHVEQTYNEWVIFISTRFEDSDDFALVGLKRHQVESLIEFLQERLEEPKTEEDEEDIGKGTAFVCGFEDCSLPSCGKGHTNIINIENYYAA